MIASNGSFNFENMLALANFIVIFQSHFNVNVYGQNLSAKTDVRPGLYISVLGNKELSDFLRVI